MRWQWPDDNGSSNTPTGLLATRATNEPELALLEDGRAQTRTGNPAFPLVDLSVRSSLSLTRASAPLIPAAETPSTPALSADATRPGTWVPPGTRGGSASRPIASSRPHACSATLLTLPLPCRQSPVVSLRLSLCRDSSHKLRSWRSSTLAPTRSGLVWSGLFCSLLCVIR